MVVEPLAFLAGEATVELSGEVELGLPTRGGILELVREGAAGTEEECLECALGEIQDLRNFVVRATFQLAQDERLALALGKALEPPDELLDRRATVVRRLLGDDVAVELHLDRTGLLLPEALAHDVVGDRDQPVRRLPRPFPPFEGTEGVDERRLHDVLGIGMVAEDGVCIAVHLAGMAPIQVIEGARGSDRGFCGGHQHEPCAKCPPRHPPLRGFYR